MEQSRKLRISSRSGLKYVTQVEFINGDVGKLGRGDVRRQCRCRVSEHRDKRGEEKKRTEEGQRSEFESVRWKP